MSKTSTLQAAPPAVGWRRWRFHLSALLLILPILYLPKYFDNLALNQGLMGLGQRPAGEVQVGPWQLQMAEWEVGPPKSDPAGMVKTFTMAQCAGCQDQIRAVYLRVGKPRSLRAAGSIFFGSPHRAFASLPIPVQTAPDADIWITAEGWDGSVHQVAWPIASASPATADWLKKGAKQ